MYRVPWQTARQERIRRSLSKLQAPMAPQHNGAPHSNGAWHSGGAPHSDGAQYPNGPTSNNPTHSNNEPDLPWPSLTDRRPRHIPVVGPTEALRRRSHGAERSAGDWADVPSGSVPDRSPSAVPDPPSHERQSRWQLAQQVWQDSGVDWEDTPAPAYRDDAPDPYAPEPYSADAYSPGPFADSFLDDTDDDLIDPHPTRPDLPVLRDPADSRLCMGPWPVQPSQEESRPVAPVARRELENLVERGDPEPDHDPEAVSRGAVARNAEPVNAAAGGAASQAPPLPRRIRGAFPGIPSSAFAPASPFAPSPAFAAPQPYGSATALESPRTAEEAPAFASAPLGAPVGPPLGRAAAPPAGEPDELFRAWQGSVEQAVGRRGPRPGRRPAGPAARRALGWQVAKIGVPAAVIVTVGAGALMMLTGRANEMLADRASNGALASGRPSGDATATGQPTAGRAGAGTAGLTLAGYPGEHGSAGVTALWSAGGTTMAVGFADNHPAVWRHASDGTWSLVAREALGGLTGHFTSVADGPGGWIAVGSMNEHVTVEPVVFWSPDGVAWTPQAALTNLAGNGAQFLGVAAGPGGYLVVGKYGSGNQAHVALWWSADLKNWTNGETNGGAGSFAAAAVAVGNGFVAAGSENNCHTIWTSPDGRNWTAHDLAKPSGATSATLNSVATDQSGRFVAAGFATTGAGNIPVVVTSADGGAHLSQAVLSAAGQPAHVSAVTSTSDGFVAVGQAGPANAQHAVEWTSTDGLTWSAATRISAVGTGQVTALTDTGTMVTGTMVTGTVVTGTAQGSAGPAVLTIGQ
jgi:hypothetical protein